MTAAAVTAASAVVSLGPEAPLGAVEPSLALYVHMPWCVRKCPYCDFNSHQLKSAAPDSSYIDALIRDFDTELPFLRGRRIDTVFFGGGTPSLFQPEDFSRLLGAMRRRIEFADEVEVTLEANPGTTDEGRFSAFRAAGVNRLSIGVQSFAAPQLVALGRQHSGGDAVRAYQTARAAGFENVSLDLIHGAEGQTEQGAARDAAAAVALGPEHLSCYALTLTGNADALLKLKA